MTSTSGGAVELQLLFCAIALGLAQLLLATGMSVLARGLPWGVGARDAPPPPLGKYGARAGRAWKNFIETFAFFAAAVLLAHALNASTPASVLGAKIYLWSRVLYVPLYMIGVPLLRTVAWGASLAGIVMALTAIWPG